MRVLGLLLLLGLLATLPVLAEEAAPILKYSGYLSGKQGERAIIEVGNRGYLLSSGIMVGDYKVVSLDPDQLILESPSGNRFPYPLNGRLLEAPPEARLKMRLDGAPTSQVTKALASVSGVGVYTDSTLKTRLRFGGPAQSLTEALGLLFPAGGVTGKTVRIAQGEVWLVGRPPLVQAVASAFTGSRHRGKKVVFDFVEAEFRYVMKTLAAELGVSLIMEKGIDGAVTITTPPGGLPAEDLVAAITAGAGFTYRLDATTLLVGRPEWVRASEKNEGKN